MTGERAVDEVPDAPRRASRPPVDGARATGEAPVRGSPLGPRHLLSLQRGAGNRAVSAMLAKPGRHAGPAAVQRLDTGSPPPPGPALGTSAPAPELG
ncbi:MAG TPA: hypothetical protein VJT31_22860, partial [Rugosimonospora sp.]|nr:hypothetical protein [Rugosimonospora sp.]